MKLEKNDYIYKALATRVIDGDTIIADIDLGFSIKTKQIIRLSNINAPETRTKNKLEKIAGNAIKEELKHQLFNADGTPKKILIKTYKSDSFGRFIGNIYLYTENRNFTDNKDLNEYLNRLIGVEYNKENKINWNKKNLELIINRMEIIKNRRKQT